MVPLLWSVLSVSLFWRLTKIKEENRKNVQLLQHVKASELQRIYQFIITHTKSKQPHSNKGEQAIKQEEALPY